jgi:hypothetical protein
VGLGAVVSKFSELWFGASVRSSMVFPGSSADSTPCSGISSYSPSARVVEST